MKIANEPKSPTAKQCFVKFLRSPTSISTVGDELETTFSTNAYDSEPLSESTRVSSTPQTETMKSGLILRSIGYKTVAIDESIPIDPIAGTIKNENGRVIGCGPGLYCSGWAAAGPSGVLVKTMNISFEIGKVILDDVESEVFDCTDKSGSSGILSILSAKGVKYVSYNDWKNIDQLERDIGEKYGKPREKIVDVKALLDAADKKRS